MEKEPNTLEISVVEKVGLKDVGPGQAGAPVPTPLKVTAEEMIKTREKSPGNPPLTKAQIEEKLPPEEIERRQKALVEYTRLSGRYVPAHNKKARWVESKDILEVIADGKDMVTMCQLPRGLYSGIAALAHPQIDDKDPLRFFVLPNGMVIINPVIIDHTKVPIFKDEGCMSFADTPARTMVPRYNRITVVYQTLARKDAESDPILSVPSTEELNGGPAHVFQHEISHLNGFNVYDEDFKAETAAGFGDGMLLDPEMWNRKNLKYNK